jgi:serine/threonine protein kinase
VTRVFDKVQLAKRALREITLLRHFSGHENITGLIDVDAISPDFNEIYIFMEVSPHARYSSSADFSCSSLWKVTIPPKVNKTLQCLTLLLADLHQIIKSGQVLTNEHVQYFLYQILRGFAPFTLFEEKINC